LVPWSVLAARMFVLGEAAAAVNANMLAVHHPFLYVRVFMRAFVHPHVQLHHTPDMTRITLPWSGTHICMTATRIDMHAVGGGAQHTLYARNPHVLYATTEEVTALPASLDHVDRSVDVLYNASLDTPDMYMQAMMLCNGCVLCGRVNRHIAVHAFLNQSTKPINRHDSASAHGRWRRM
jgi:hypothetical protein